MSKVNKILSGKGNEVARIFFSNWYSLREASKIFKANLKSNNHGTVSSYFHKFKKLGWLDEKPILKEFKREYAKGKWSTYPNKRLRYRLNLEPFYLYCGEKDIKFNKDEKKFLESNEPNMIQLQWHRIKILKEFPKEYLPEAIIKFYIKHFSIPSIEFLDRKNREIWEMTEKHIEEEIKRGELLKKGLLKKRRKPSVLSDYFDKLKTRKLSLKERKEWGYTFEHLFSYTLNFKKNPELITNINQKFKKALGILA